MNVFFSYSERDQPLAERLAAGLRQGGFEVWDESLIFPGDNWAESTAEALQQSEAMVVLLTPNSVHSWAVRRAILFAIGQPKYKGRLIPVVAAPSEEILSEVPWFLRHEPFSIVQTPNLESDDGEVGKVVQALKAVA